MALPVQKRVHSNEARHKDDFYATSYETTEYLLQFEEFHQRIIEPACGEGHISKVLIQAGYDVQSFDLVDRGYGLCGLDFLKDEMFDKFKSQADFIINPPYSLAMEFISRALELTHRKVAILLPTDYLNRLNWCPHLKTVLCFARHTDIAKNADFELYHGKNMKNYAWFIFDTIYSGNPELKVIKNIKRESDLIAELRAKYLNKSVFDINENEIKKIAKSASKEEIEQLIFNLHKKGISNRKIGKLLNVSEGKVRYKLKGGESA